MALRTISLCAGVAGIDLGLRLADPGIRTVCYVEWSHFPAAVIAARIEDGSLDSAPVWDDVGTFDGRPWRGAVDLVTAGFPCQPVSLAGKRLGMADERFIWDDIARVIAEVDPRYVFLENVPGILTADRGAFLDYVLSSLVELGFDCEWDLFSAEETGAPHRRQRWFCLGVADTNSGNGYGRAEPADRWSRRSGLSGQELADAGRQRIHAEQPLALGGRGGSSEPRAACPELADAPRGVLRTAEDDGIEGWSPREERQSRGGGASVYPPARNDHAGWATVPEGLEPSVCRDADGLAPGLDPALFAYRSDRLRAVGNGVVPLTAALAWIELNRRIGQ